MPPGTSGDFDDDLLDAPRRLGSADSGGLLRAAATAGAQVRATTAAAQEAGLDQLGGQRPRALVLLTRPGAAPAAAPLLLALLGPSCPVPVVTTRSVPMWVGALDIVLANTTDPGDRELAEGIDRAVRRGAQVMLTAPADGPVAAAAAGRAVLLVPSIEVPPGLTLPRALSAGLLLLDTLELLETDTEVLAGELDREAERDYVAHESLVNPAKALMVRHDDPGAAACAAAVLALRFDFAALYLGLGRGVLGGPGWTGSTGGSGARMSD